MVIVYLCVQDMAASLTNWMCSVLVGSNVSCLCVLEFRLTKSNISLTVCSVQFAPGYHTRCLCVSMFLLCFQFSQFAQCNAKSAQLTRAISRLFHL